MTRRLVAAAALAASALTTVGTQPATAQCPVLGCIVRGCYDVWGGVICFD